MPWKVWLPAGKAGIACAAHRQIISPCSNTSLPACPASLRAQAGDCQQVLACFERMKQLGLERNSFTYR